MRILMVIPRFPYPPDRGDTVRSWALLRDLADRHDVWLACVDRDPPAEEHLSTVTALCRDVYVATRSPYRALLNGAVAMLRGRSLTEGYFYDRRLVQRLTDWSAEVGFDALVTYSSCLAPQVAGVAAPARVLDMVDVDSLKWALYARRSWWPLTAFYRREARCVATLEARSARQHDVTLLVNERERRKLTERVPAIATDVLPTAVDVDEFAALAARPLPAEPVIGMVGSMFYPPNVRAVQWFGRYVWPLVQRQVPQARWQIVGARPTRAVQEWGRQPNVEVTGYVPDVQPYLANARVFVNAVDGDIGVQSKLVVAMAAGRACVVTPDSAAGIDYADPPPFLIASAPTGFAEAVVRVLRDDAQARALAERARATAVAHYSRTTQTRRIERWLSPQTAHPAAAVRDAAVTGAGELSVAAHS
jgi:sugar transferase (PEP-CTERM/EpsH1 system associated)